MECKAYVGFRVYSAGLRAQGVGAIGVGFRVLRFRLLGF